MSLFSNWSFALNWRRGDTHKLDRKTGRLVNTAQQGSEILLSCPGDSGPDVHPAQNLIHKFRAHKFKTADQIPGPDISNSSSSSDDDDGDDSGVAGSRTDHHSSSGVITLDRLDIHQLPQKQGSDVEEVNPFVWPK